MIRLFHWFILGPVYIYSPDQNWRLTNDIFHTVWSVHYSDIILSEMASQITGVSIVCSSVCSGRDQRKQQSPGSMTSQRASYAENVSFWWRHVFVISLCIRHCTNSLELPVNFMISNQIKSKIVYYHIWTHFQLQIINITKKIQDSRFKIQTSFIPWKYKYSYLQQYNEHLTKHVFEWQYNIIWRLSLRH